MLSIESLITEAEQFCKINSGVYKPELFGITDGKAVGTFVEHLFKDHLEKRYDLTIGNSADGLDIPCDDVSLYKMAGEILDNPPQIGYLTISNALQWRLHYSRIVALSDNIDGIKRIIKFKDEQFDYSNSQHELSKRKFYY